MRPTSPCFQPGVSKGTALVRFVSIEDATRYLLLVSPEVLFVPDKCRYLLLVSPIVLFIPYTCNIPQIFFMFIVYCLFEQAINFTSH